MAATDPTTPLPAGDAAAAPAAPDTAPTAAHVEPTAAQAPAPARARRSRPKALRLIQALTVLVIVLALAAALYFREHLQQLQHLGYGAVFLVGMISSATVVIPVPGLAVSGVMGGVLNPWLVGLVGGLGQAMGELSGYMAGYSGQQLVGRSKLHDRLARWTQRYGGWAIFGLAAVPNPAFDIAGLAAGALRFPLWKFVLSCVAGEIVKNTLIAMAGYFGIDALLRWFG
jgi:uncharacterized membrane protein YdjX (TVP38/TMEM64 family)